MVTAPFRTLAVAYLLVYFAAAVDLALHAHSSQVEGAFLLLFFLSMPASLAWHYLPQSPSAFYWIFTATALVQAGVIATLDLPIILLARYCNRKNVA